MNRLDSIIRRTAGFSLCVVLATALAGQAFGQANVDLRLWSEVTQTSGNWNVASDGSSVTQTINGAPTIFLSPNTFQNTTIEGSFRVTTSSDDDFIGFVFGLTSPTSPGGTIDALLLDWKQGVQSGANSGFRLSYVTGTINTSTATSSPYWTHTTASGTTFDALGTLAGDNAAGYGWVDNTTYDFTLDYSTTHLSIAIQGGTGVYQSGLEVFNIDVTDPAAAAAFPGGAFPDGHFGFYNFSQASVVYESFTRTDDPALATTPSDGGTVDFGNVRVTGSSTETLDVANAGGPGSTLTGNVPTPTNPAFSLETSPDSFSLGEGESTSFDYSFNPTARGTVSEWVNVSSNDPANTDGNDILLQGQGVGPVYSAAGTVDFGSVLPDTSADEVLAVMNITSDGDLGDLTGLTLNDIQIGGADAGLFSLVGFAAGQTVAGGQSFDLTVAFAGDSTLGLKEAFLSLYTDEGAALGGAGSNYQVTLTAEVIPEPATVSLLALGLGTLAMRRRRG